MHGPCAPSKGIFFASPLSVLSCVLCSSIETGGRATSFMEQDSFEDEFADLGVCVAMYQFDGECHCKLCQYVAYSHCVQAGKSPLPDGS